MKSFTTPIILLTLVTWATASARGQTVRIATFNVNWGNRYGDDVLDAIETSNADVVCLQETTPQSEQFLREQLSDIYPSFHAAGYQGKYLAERFVFASKLAPRDLQFQPPKAGLFGFYAATFSVGGKEVRVINAHLSPFIVRRNAGMLDVMAAISTTEEKHAAETAAIAKTIDPEIPTITVGDFNSLSTFHAPKRLVALGFTDSFAAIHPDADAHATWRWPTRPVPLSLRIDYIFHSKHFKTIDSEIIRCRGSDHALLVSELEFVVP